MSEPQGIPVDIKARKNFVLHNKTFECLQLAGPQGNIWFAKSTNLAENVVLAKPTWKELKQAMQERINGETEEI